MEVLADFENYPPLPKRCQIFPYKILRGRTITI